MEQFEIIIKNEKGKTYRLITLFFVLLHAVFFVYLLFDAALWKKGVAGVIIILLYSGYRLLINKTGDQKFSYGSGIFFIFGVIAIFDFTWLIILDWLLFLLSTAALQKIIFYFNKQNVEQKNFPFKKFKWDQLVNVILKDNILTLDFKNNKLFQKEIEAINTNEEEFNSFATQQLMQHN